MLKSFGKMLKGGKKGSPNAEFDDLESVLRNTKGSRKRLRGQKGESKGGMMLQVEVFFTQQTTLLSIPSSIHLFTYLLHVPSFSIQRLSNGFHRRR